MHACMHACMAVCLCVCLSVCMYYLHPSIHPSIHSSIHTYIHVHIYTYICYVDKYTLCRYIYIYIQCLNNASHVSNQALPTLLRSKCVILHNCPSESHGFCHHSAISTKVMTLTAMTTRLNPLCWVGLWVGKQNGVLEPKWHRMVPSALPSTQIDYCIVTPTC